MAYGKVFPTHLPMKNPPGTACLIVKNVSEVQEFAELVHEEDNTRRLLELREESPKQRRLMYHASLLDVSAEQSMQTCSVIKIKLNVIKRQHPSGCRKTILLHLILFNLQEIYLFNLN